MFSRWSVICLFGLLTVVGCSTIFNAQEAQRAEEAKGAGVVVPAERLDLCGYTLRELVDFALTNRPSMAAAALAVVDARLSLLKIAADAPLVSYSPWTSPKIYASGGYNAASSSDKQLRWRTDGNASAGLSIDILIYDFGRNRSLAEAQVERVIAAEYDLVREGYAVFSDVATSYFTLLNRDALLEVARTNETELALHLRQAEDRLAAGEAQKLDVTRAKLDLSLAREETIAASNLVVTAGAELMRALGVDASRGTRDEVFPTFGNSLDVSMRGFLRTTYGVSEAFELARTNAPAMSIARARLRAASRTVDYAIADLMPSVSAELSINWADPLWIWHWGVNAVQSVFEGFGKVTAVDQAVVAMESASAAVDETEQELSLEIEKAIAVRDNAMKARETARVSVVSARENLDMVKVKYLEGEASRVDFTDAVSSYAEALGSRSTAFYNGQKAEAALFALLGRLPDYQEGEVKE